MWGGRPELPDAEPGVFADAHFVHGPQRELTDQFRSFLDWDEYPEDYPVNPVSID